MKKVNLLFVSLLILSGSVISQETNEEFKPSGKAFGKVFGNYNYNFSDKSEQRSSFQLQRAYLGYKHKFSNDLSAKVTLDAGRQVKDAEGKVLSPYTAMLKHAQLDWRISVPVKLSIGLIGLKQFDTQEKFWGYRYLYKSFQDEFALGSSADLGVNAEIKLTKALKANVFVLNGEGYSRLQDDMGRMKLGGNLIFEPVKGLLLKGYYDIYGGNVMNDSSIIIKDTVSIHTIAFFAGYKTDKFRLGAEYDLQLNGKKFYQVAADHNIAGIAVYGNYIINKKVEIFAEWLQFKSNTLEGEQISWNSSKDGNIIVAGLQYSPVKGVKTALNVREFMYNAEGKDNAHYVYLNFEFAF